MRAGSPVGTRVAGDDQAPLLEETMHGKRRPGGPLRTMAFVAPVVLVTMSGSVGFTSGTPSGQGISAGPDTLSPPTLVTLLRKKVKYVFVLYQENRSFDSYFGTYPGADGLYADENGPYADPTKLPGFVQPLVTTTGAMGTISPFPIGPDFYAADTDDINHAHPVIVKKMDVAGGAPQMDRFALTEEEIHSPGGALPAKGQPVALAAEQFGELSMAYEDCSTVPFLWRWAANFTLADHIFQDMTGPSTPGNLSIIGAQSGVTQWIEHPDEAFFGQAVWGSGVPMLDDADPFWGSGSDPNPPAKRLPYNHYDMGYTRTGASQTVPSASSPIQINLTYATLPLTLQGRSIGSVVENDRYRESDLGDIEDDVDYLTHQGGKTLDWGWYQEGFGSYFDDSQGPAVQGTHAAYVTHHNGPQYFGYIANNDTLAAHLHGLHAFYTTLQAGRLPSSGGVFYVKGSYYNELGLTPADPDTTVQRNFLGDDDHPQYSDAQISEALLAAEINAIARSKYWAQSVIIVTWDDSEGDYDHVPPPVQSFGPDHLVMTDGPRVPLLVISPYAKTGFVDHEKGSQASVVKFVDTLFGLTPLAELPDELAARKEGETRYGSSNLGPSDALTPGVGDLLGAFDLERLSGRTAPVPASAAVVPTTNFAPRTQMTLGCAYAGVTPVTPPSGLGRVPADFNPRPSTNPGPYVNPSKAGASRRRPGR
jgi:phospholipase C